MPRFEISAKKFVDYNNDFTSNIHFNRDGARPLILNPTQSRQLFMSLETIDEDADLCFKGLSADDKQEFSHHLGWGCFLTVLKYKEQKYYDIRRWWMPPGSDKPTPTRTGIRLNRNEVDKLICFQTDLYVAVPEIANVEPCDCFTGMNFLKCERCTAPWLLSNKFWMKCEIEQQQ